MLISYSHSFIFFHVAKVAGISIREALAPYAQDPPHFRIRRPPPDIAGRPNPLYEIWSSTLTHATAQQVQKELPREFNAYYKFAFVRNPWDWQVSMYHFLRKEMPGFHLKNFHEFLEWVISQEKPFPKGATKLQKMMLVDAQGQIAVDAIGRFENLSSDFQRITARFGINVPLAQRNASLHNNYQSYYDDYCRNLVATHYAEDIDLFGYQFE